MGAATRTLPHVGEWKVEVRAASRDEAFAEVARLIAAEAGRAAGEPGPWEPVGLDARDGVTLLVDWANELIGRGEASGRAYDEVRALAIGDAGPGLRLAAEVRGRAVPDWRSPIKAATYHGASLERRGGRWRARLLFDI
ncbi:MAG: archease [Gemmatimonadota bacterium]|nr:archease [Gemmatimonadota bacterium]MDE3172909.1 archease [Gemmatimonadota bacterium]MDE3215925.1 archease [Gemmatimonadota bacterium]